MTDLNAEHVRRAIVEYTRRLAESAAAAGPDVAVPTTPGWTITDLVEHVGQSQHWVAEIIERRITNPRSCPRRWPCSRPTPASGRHGCRNRRSGSRARAPMTRSTRRCSTRRGTSGPGRDSGWPASSTRRSSTALTQPTQRADRPIWTPTSQPRSSVTTSPCSPPPRGERQRSESAHAIRGTGQTLQWLATDTADHADAWFVERRPDGATWQRGTRQANVTVTGPAQSLLLTLTRRLPLSSREATNISIDGDTDLAQHWLDTTAHVSG